MTPTAAEQPRWASPPGETIAALLHEHGLSLEDLADRAALSDPDARRLITGERTIDHSLAAVLHELLGGSPDFWLRRSDQYVESLHWVQADDIARNLPLHQLVEFGWITAQPDWVAAAQEILDFFDVSDAQEWRRRWGATVAAAHYRASEAFEPDELAVAAWLRQVEVRAARLDLAAWDPAALRETLPAIRALTTVRDPRTFIPALQQLAAAAGVAVVVERPPRGCSINGTAFTDRDGRHVIGLTARYLADDQFWFTYLHEVGHLLHGTADTVVLDDLDVEPESDDEYAANDFARTAILRGIDLAAVPRQQHRDVARAARDLQIAPGILVGQLQYAELVPRNRFNRLRRRYQWDGGDLIPADQAEKRT